MSQPLPNALQTLLPQKIPLDVQTEEILRYAAWVGETCDNFPFINLITLFIALFRHGNETSQWFFSALQRHGVDINSIESSARFTDDKRKSVEKRMNGTDWPYYETPSPDMDISKTIKSNVADLSQKAMPTLERMDYADESARAVLMTATDLWKKRSLADIKLLPMHLIAAILESKHAQINSWLKDPESFKILFVEFLKKSQHADAGGYLATILEGATDETDAHETDSDSNKSGAILSGYAFDSDALFIMRAAVELCRALASKSKRRRVLSTNVLFVSICESGFRSPPFPSATSLRSILATSPSSESAYADQLAFYLGTVSIPSIESPTPFMDDESLPRLSTNAKLILDEAQRFAAQFSSGGKVQIGVTPLCLSLVRNYNEHRGKIEKNWLARLNLTQLHIRQEYFQAMRLIVPAADIKTLENILIGVSDAVPTQFDNDRPGGEDQLDVHRYARALAGVIAAEKVEPPLSIGIFGDWGAGKSFFMGLLKNEIQTIGIKEPIHSEKKRIFCRHVVPIKFNAWHYAETNLWACLVHTIFKALESHMCGDSETADKEPWERLMSELETTGTLYAEAKEKHDKAKEAFDTAENEYNDAQDKVLEHREEVNKLKARDVVRAFMNTALEKEKFNEADKQKLADLSIIAEDQLGIEGVKGKIGGTELIPQNIYDVINDGRVLALQSYSLVDWALRLPIDKEELKRLAQWVILIFVAGCFIYGIGQLLFKSGGLAIWGTTMAEIGVSASMILGWTRRKIGAASKFITGLNQVRVQLDAELDQEREKHSEELEIKEQELKERQADLEKAGEEMEAARKAEQEAARRLQESLTPSRLARFIQHRIGAGDYEKHLGIISSIREDFNKIANFLEDRHNPEQLKAIKKLKERGELNKMPKPVDRIVLFIDDLDRCPASRVVNVLEAIHLLLAIPLFVVVVGVDLRWVISSLHRRYRYQLAEASFLYSGDGQKIESEDKPSENTDQSKKTADSQPSETEMPLARRETDTDMRATALDYIEKIFQIPFWLPPMEKHGSENLIRYMLNGTRKTDTQALASKEDDTEVQKTPAMVNATITPTHTGADSAKYGSGEVSDTSDTTSGDVNAAQNADREKQEQETTMAGLSTIKAEDEFMVSLAGTTGRSPRRLKRFVNSYRVLKASLTPLDKETFIIDDGQKGDFLSAMTLLAITTGAPTLADKVLRYLYRPGTSATLSAAKNDINAMSGNRSELRNVIEALTRYESYAGGAAESLEALGRWAPRVARFTFRSGRL